MLLILKHPGIMVSHSNDQNIKYKLKERVTTRQHNHNFIFRGEMVTKFYKLHKQIMKQRKSLSGSKHYPIYLRLTLYVLFTKTFLWLHLLVVPNNFYNSHFCMGDILNLLSTSWNHLRWDSFIFLYWSHLQAIDFIFIYLFLALPIFFLNNKGF